MSGVSTPDFKSDLQDAENLASDAASITDVSSSGGMNSPRKMQKNLYASVWRWHFYAGLLTAPLLWIVTITGAIYTFRNEIIDVRDRHLLTVVPAGERKTYTELQAIAEAATTDGKLESVVVSAEETRSVRFIFHHEPPAEESGPSGGKKGKGTHEAIFVNPYTGAILGSQIEEHDFFVVVLDLHRRLMLGSTGRYLTELVAGWSILLVLTGLYLWWPRGKKNLGVFLPRVKGKLYTVLRDWHSVSGFYLAPVMIIIAMTGLVFSITLGSQFSSTAKSLGHWPASNWFKAADSGKVPEGTPPASLDQVVFSVMQHADRRDLGRIKLAREPNESHRASLIYDDDKNTVRAIDIDQYTGQVMSIMSPADLKLMYRIRLWSVSTHMGKIFGMPTKILAFLASVGMLLLSVTGIWMWWVRRPQKRMGFPRRPAFNAFPAWGWGVILLFAIILPVTGISILIVGLIDCIVGVIRASIERRRSLSTE